MNATKQINVTTDRAKQRDIVDYLWFLKRVENLSGEELMIRRRRRWRDGGGWRLRHVDEVEGDESRRFA
ncbi:hypothetical protein EUTSA_v10019411mg [Eutrema salsugineum]|uniref:Uncharacterized protein n=1 Tax=Eutrema salsugineum TaxID=72664 RepID=V4KCC2_EUTSA|nr:hypothetical protein EUTSA_v10019411mg [Eutrema salsugineum]